MKNIILLFVGGEKVFILSFFLVTSSYLSFIDFGLSQSTLLALQKKGYTTPTPIQALVIPKLMAGPCNLIGQAQTGTGKTAAFGIPLIEKIIPGSKYIQALILTPTRELALQVSSEISSFHNLSIRITSIYGGTPLNSQIRSLNAGADIVVGTPGRIIDHLKRGTLTISHISYFILDEADEMLAMGFIDDVREIIRHINPTAHKLLFSATMPRDILTLAKEFMPGYELLNVEKKELTTTQVKQFFIPCYERDKPEILVRILDAHPDMYTIIFCQTKQECDNVLMYCLQKGYDAETIHGDIAQPQREKTLTRFKNKTIHILIATDVAARGIDINNITHVINYSFPKSTDRYVHRIGRTGRAGKTGTAISFVTPTDHRHLNLIRRNTKAQIDQMSIPLPHEIISGKKRHLIDQIAKKKDVIPASIRECADEILTTHTNPYEVICALLAIKWEKDFNIACYKGRLESPTLEKKQNDGLVKDKLFTRGGSDVRLFVARGKNHGYQTIPDLLSYFNRETNISTQSMNNVRLMNDCSFVSLSATDAFKFMKHFNAGIQGPKLVRYAKEKEHNGQNHNSKGGKYKRHNPNEYTSHDQYDKNRSGSLKESNNQKDKKASNKGKYRSGNRHK